MKTIDFLPARYREKSTKQKTQAWRGAVVASFCGLLAVGALGQFEIERELENHVELVLQQYEKVVAEGNNLSELQRQLREARSEAELLTYLRHPWPRSQILARVVEPLSDAIALRKLEIKQDEAGPAAVVARPPGQPTSEAAAAKEELPIAQRTLKKLREPLDDAPLTVTLEGISQESAALHVYLGKLAESEWFSAVELQSIERLEDGQSDGFRFAARLIVRPGYGHPSAPPLKRELAAHKDEQKPAGG